MRAIADFPQDLRTHRAQRSECLRWIEPHLDYRDRDVRREFHDPGLACRRREKIRQQIRGIVLRRKRKLAGIRRSVHVAERDVDRRRGGRIRFDSAIEVVLDVLSNGRKKCERLVRLIESWPAVPTVQGWSAGRLRFHSPRAAPRAAPSRAWSHCPRTAQLKTAAIQLRSTTFYCGGSSPHCILATMGTEDLLLSGAHVRLEPLHPSHVEGLVAAASEDTFLYQWTLVPRNEIEAIRYVNTALAWRQAGEAMPFAIVRGGDKVVIGSTRFWNLERWSWPSRSLPAWASHLRCM